MRRRSRCVNVKTDRARKDLTLARLAIYFFILKSTMLSVTARHALRALVSLAAEPDDKPMLGKELAERASIPANYLSKIHQFRVSR